MRYIRHKIILAMALIILAVTLTLWLLSAFFAVGFCVGINCGDPWEPLCGVYSPNSRIYYYHTIVPPIWRDQWGMSIATSHPRVRFLGFNYFGYSAPPHWYYAIGIPFWFTALISNFVIYRCLRRPLPRFGPGLCQICGYDLRATPFRCPECGTPTAAGIFKHE